MKDQGGHRPRRGTGIATTIATETDATATKTEMDTGIKETKPDIGAEAEIATKIKREKGAGAETATEISKGIGMRKTERIE